ncbi:MAG TPA: type II secretion system protein GspG [Pyrinomonadaceae bacterium]
MSRRRIFLSFAASLLLLVCLAGASDAQSKSPLSAGAARNVIRRMTGVDLPSSAVLIRNLSSPDKLTVDVSAQIETAFRFVKEQERWRVAEVRTGDNRWEETRLILSALKVEATADACAETRAAERDETDPGAWLARCLLAQLLAIELPSDAARVRSVSSLALGNAPSAVVEARVELEVRLRKGTDGKWRVAEVRAGNNQWADAAALVASVNEQKRLRALDELKTIALALEAFRRERGFYVAAQSASALVDQLNPRYLRSVLRVDPWHKPYAYEGAGGAYVLRSDGMDGRPNTADDIVIKNDGGERLPEANN